jgi:hypothetical protein
MKKRLKFGKSQEVTNQGVDSRSFLFPFSVVDSELIGKPEEAANTSEHRLVVKITMTRLAAWQKEFTAEGDLEKVFFEIGRQAVAERVKEETLEEKHVQIVTTDSHCSKLPFLVSRLIEPDGACYEVSVERKDRFQMSSPIQDSDGGTMRMSDSDILHQSKTFILTELGRLDDISEEFANTVANVYHRFVKLRYSEMPSSDSLQKGCEYPAELAKILSDYKAAKKMVAHLRRLKMEADPTVATLRKNFIFPRSNTGSNTTKTNRCSK